MMSLDLIEYIEYFRLRSQYIFPLHDAMWDKHMRSLHILLLQLSISRVLSIKVIEYTFLLHVVIAICGKHILSLHSTVDYPLQLHVILLTHFSTLLLAISPILSLVVSVCYSNSSELHYPEKKHA